MRGEVRSATLRQQLHRRARAVRWALSLLAVAGAGLAASAQAASHSQGVAAMTEALGCSSSVLELDLQIDERVGGYAVAGVVVGEVAPPCVGETVRASVTGADGAVLASGRVVLVEGRTAAFEDGPVDARDVVGLHHVSD